MQNIFINELFDLSHTIAKPYLDKFDYGWLAVPKIKAIIYELIKSLDKNEYRQIIPDVWIHKSVKMTPTAQICPPCIIDEGSEIRHGAFIRGSVLIGKGCVVGNSTEVKNAILFDGVQVPHFNYIGDSILGYKAHLGAGAIISNVRCDKSKVLVKGEKTYATGLKKFGSLIGDGVEIGCNSVINPGTVIQSGVLIYPLSSVKGVVEKGVN